MLGVSDGTRPWYFAARVHARADSAAEPRPDSNTNASTVPSSDVPADIDAQHLRHSDHAPDARAFEGAIPSADAQSFANSVLYSISVAHTAPQRIAHAAANARAFAGANYSSDSSADVSDSRANASDCSVNGSDSTTSSPNVTDSSATDFRANCSDSSANVSDSRANDSDSNATRARFVDSCL